MRAIEEIEGAIKNLKENVKERLKTSKGNQTDTTLRSLRKALKRKQRKRRVLLEDNRRMEARNKKKKTAQSEAGG